jgi:hypothetical protein
MTEPPATSKETAMTTLTSLIRPAAPAFSQPARRPVLRGLVVICVSALIAAGFVLDVAGGARSRPRNQVVQQAADLA